MNGILPERPRQVDYNGIADSGDVGDFDNAYKHFPEERDTLVEIFPDLWEDSKHNTQEDEDE
jgi:hypothetical protein